MTAKKILKFTRAAWVGLCKIMMIGIENKLHSLLDRAGWALQHYMDWDREQAAPSPAPAQIVWLNSVLATWQCHTSSNQFHTMVITFVPSEHVRFIRQLSKTRLYCQSETGLVRVVRDEEWLSWRQALFFNWPDPSDDIDAPTDHLEPLSGSALDRELRTLFGTDDEAEGRSTASTTTGQYVDAGEPTITAAGAPSTAAAAPDRSLPVERPAKRTKCSHEGAASVGHPRSSGYPLDHATYVGAYFRFGMLHAKGFVHKVYTGPPDQDPPANKLKGAYCALTSGRPTRLQLSMKVKRCFRFNSKSSKATTNTRYGRPRAHMIAVGCVA